MCETMRTVLALSTADGRLDPTSVLHRRTASVWRRDTTSYLATPDVVKRADFLSAAETRSQYEAGG